MYSSSKRSDFDGELCLACQTLFRGVLQDNTGDGPKHFRKGPHHDTAISFQQAVEGGCRICMRIWNRISHISWRDILSANALPGGFTSYNVTLFSSLADYGLLCFFIDRHTLPNHLTSKYITLIKMLRVKDEDYVESESILEDNTGSLRNLNQISRWMNRATTLGDGLDRTLRQGFYPTRLLKLQGGSNPLVKLVVTNESKIDGHYATLSHCWGTGQPLKLTTENLEHLKSGFSIDILPRTFQDAVVVALHLNIEYLWIDSLCIVQDSTKDWENEVERMDAVYSNCHCNIAASHATDGEGGLFVRRRPGQARALIVRTEWENMQNQDVLLHDTQFWRSRVDDAPLNERGWVLQERLLAPRTIHFTHDQILWENGQDRACETYPDGQDGLLLERFTPQVQGVWSSRSPEVDLDPYEIWEEIVQRYTQCMLTNPEDKLPAIAGIASHVQRMARDDYLAGLWKCRFPHDLLWHVVIFKAAQPRRAQPYRAPSWSWASLDDAMCMFPSSRGCDVVYIKILDWDIITANESAFSRVRSGHIRVSGILCPMVARKLEDHRIEYPYCLVVASSEFNWVIPDLAFDEPMTIFCLPVRQRLRVEITSDDPIWTVVDCLLLHATEIQGTYSRFGVCEIPLEEFESLQKEGLFEDKAEWYECDGKNTLKLV